MADDADQQQPDQPDQQPQTYRLPTYQPITIPTDSQPPTPAASSKSGNPTYRPPSYKPIGVPQSEQQQTGPIVSPDAADDDIIRSFGFDPAVINKSPTYQRAVKNFGSGFKVPFLQAGGTDLAKKIAASPLGGLGMGAWDLISGVAQGFQHLQGALGLDPEDTPYVDLLARFAQENYKQNILQNQPPSTATRAARLAGNVIASSALPGGKLAASERLLPALGGGALVGTEAGLAQPVVTGSPGDYATQKAMQAGVGAVTGLGGTAAVRGVSSLPFVAGAARWLQGKLPEEAATEFSTNLKARLEGNWGDLSDVQQAAAAGNRTAKILLGDLHATGNNPDAITQAAIGLENFRTSQHASELYNEVSQLADPLGNVPLPNTTKAIRTTLGELSQAKVQNPPLQHYLNGIQESLADQPPTREVSSLLDEFGRPAVTEVPGEPADNSYSLMHGLVSDLGDRIRAERTGADTLLGTKDVGHLQQIKNALERDLDAFTSSESPELARAADTANKYYRDVRVPFKDPNIAKAGVKDEQDTIFNTFVKRGRGDLAQKFYNSLDPRGRGAVQYGIVNKAIEDATDPISSSLDPAKFVQALRTSQQASQVFFQGQDKAVLDGLQNMMIHAARVNRTASYLAPASVPLEAAAMVGHTLGVPGVYSGASAALGVLPLALKGLLMTDAGRRLLYNASSAQPFSSAMAKLFGQLRYFTPAVARGAATVTAPSTGFRRGGEVDNLLRRTIDRRAVLRTLGA